MERRDDEADRAGVDVAEHMPADDLVRRADVAARAAANAAQRLAERGVLAHRGATVVEKDEVQFLWAVHADLRLELDVRGPRRPGDELGVRAELLACRAAREELQYRHRVVERRDDLLDAHERDVHRRERRREIGVALVRDEDERARLRDQDVAARDADVRLDE